MPHTHALTITGDIVRKRFVSWDRGEAEREWTGLTTLARHTPDLAPEPIAFETEDGAPVVVMSRLPGTPLESIHLSDAQIQALASALRCMFFIPVEPGLAERAFGPSLMRAAIRDWVAEQYNLQPCQDPAVVRDALEAARTWLAADDPAHDQLVDPVIARSDGNLDNVLWDGNSCRLIDFEEFGTSDIAYELADIAEHASSRLRRLLDVDRLLDAIELDPVQRRRVATYRRLMATFWLVMLLPGNGGFRRNPPGSTEDQAHRVLTLLG